MKEKWLVPCVFVLGVIITILTHSHWRTLPFFLTLSFLITVILGNYFVRIFDPNNPPSIPILEPVEKILLRMGGTPSPQSMTWQAYCKALILFNAVSGLFIFLILAVQAILPGNALHLPMPNPFLIFNIACGFITNTEWQSYSGEQTLSNLSQMLAVTFGMVIGAVSGIAVFLAFIRGLTSRPMGNFYQDITRTFVYVLCPVMLLGSLFFIIQGMPQTFHQQVIVHTLEGAMQKIAVGPVASLVTLKLFGNDGGGFFNANSAHPFENPNALTNFVSLMLELAVPMGLLYTFGLWLGDKKQMWMIWIAMMLMLMATFTFGNAFEQAGNTMFTHQNISQLRTPYQSGGNMEGKEVRFGILPSMLFTTVTTSTSTGAVNNMHDSLTPLGGMVPLVDLMLNVVYAGVGMIGFLVYGIVAVFLTGLMVGRTPEIFGKRLEKPEMVLASIYILLHPVLSLLPAAIAVIAPFGLSSLGNIGPHGLTEILYAYTSTSADNGSAFAGLNANTAWYNLSIGVVILLGRFIPIVVLLAIAGSLQSKVRIPISVATLKTNTVLFTCIWIGTIIVVGALTFVPVLALGPIAEQLSMLSGRLY